MRRSILTPLDGSEISEAALPWAVKLAQDRGLALVLARVVEYPQMSSEVWGPSAATTDLYEQVLTYEQEQATQYLAELRERLSETGLPVQTVVQTGSPVVALLDLVDQIGADTIVMASHGRSGLKRLVLGSVAHQLLAHATVPVFLVRAEPPEQQRTPAFSRLLVPLDGSSLAERAIPAAQAIAAPGATIQLTRVAPWPPATLGAGTAGRLRDNEAAAYRVSLAHAYLERVAAPLRAAGFTVKPEVIVGESTGSVGHHLAVAAAAGDVDVVAMSTHGRGGVTGWLLGSVADEVARSVDRPVFLVSARAAARSVAGRALVGEVMTPGVMALQEDEPLVVALRKLVRRRASGAPVLGAEGNVTGVISQRDILAWHARTIDALAQDRQPTPETYLQLLRTEPVSAVMTSPAATIAETATVDAALALMRERGLHRLPVTRNGTLVGIITGSDILLAMLGQLESGHAEYRAEELQPTAEELIAAGA
jgi:nucleotide-binding universal stress UspA family protein/predicted transcriptional regulator